MEPDAAPLDPVTLRCRFDATEPYTVGIEEEVVLIDPHTGAPAPVAAEIVAEAADARIKTELPACQVELMTRPHHRVSAAVAELASLRTALRRVCGSAVHPVAAAVHPFAVEAGVMLGSRRSQALVATYGQVAARQLVGSLQVHVALGCADRALAVHNALRGHLPELAALAAAAPFHDGQDTGYASVRPLIAGQLPRQGIPPVIESWEAFAGDLAWGAASGRIPDHGQWWWELRPHVLHGTLEVRVPDVQPTVAAAAAVIGVVHALVRNLGTRYDRGEPLPAPPTWRIAENRWAALRDGVHGALTDLVTGETVPTEKRLHQMIDEIEPEAPHGLDGARALVQHNTADALRDTGITRALPWLAEAFAS